MSEEPKVDLKILTDKQRQAYRLRQEGLSFKAIGEAMGIQGSTASKHVREAERRFREKAEYDAWATWNREPILISTTQGQVQALLDCLYWLASKMGIQAAQGDWKDWRGKLPYEMRFLKEFVEQIQLDLYGRVRRKGWGPWDE